MKCFFRPVLREPLALQQTSLSLQTSVMKSIRPFLIVIGLAPSFLFGSNTPPNILFIYTDDQSHRTVSAYPEAHDFVRTPNIDALARSGVRFANAYIGTWCMPSRATMLTGRHPFGIESMRMEGPYPGSTYDPDQCPFWPKHFREKGYVTAQIGKWHTGTDTGMGRDWDYQIVWNRPKFTDTAMRYFYDQEVTFPDGTTREVPEYSTDAYTQWALEFIRAEKGRPDAEKPWYLWLCYGAVHSPFTPAKRHIGKLADAEVPVPVDIFPPRPGKPDWMQTISDFQEGPDGYPMLRKRRFDDAVRRYHEGVMAIDEGVGRLVAALEDSGQIENTLIVFTSDQGYAWGQHGFRRKWAGYDATLRAPLIFSMPSKLPSGTVVETPVGGVDLIPTFYHFAGLDLPWEMHGHDLTPLLEDPEADWQHPVLITCTNRTYGFETANIPVGEDLLHRGMPWYAMTRQGRFKYIRSLLEGEKDELYDLENDPGELTNLTTSPEHAERLRHMRSALVKELHRTEAPFAGKLPAPAR